MPPSSAEAATSADPLAVADNEAITLGNSETLTLAFAPPAAIEGRARSCFIGLRAKYALQVAAATHAQSLSEAPVRFSLSQGQPNPFGRSTSMRFDVPRRARIRIEAFDVMGRRVRTLTNAEYPAGSHAVSWNGSDDEGQPTSAGVYLVRMSAPGFVAQRRVVRLSH